MTLPITTRLDDETLAALDQAVKAGRAPNRAAAIAEALKNWLRDKDWEALIEEWQAEHGAFTEEERAQARLEMGITVPAKTRKAS